MSITAGLTALGLGYRAYQFYQLKSKVSKTTEGNEILFTEKEAKMVEDVIKSIAKKERKQSDVKAHQQLSKTQIVQIEELEKAHQEGFLSDAEFEKRVSGILKNT